jgi:hypothetical protein
LGATIKIELMLPRRRSEHPAAPLANILIALTTEQQPVVFDDQTVYHFPVIDPSTLSSATAADASVSQCCRAFQGLFEFSPKFLRKMKDLRADSFIVKLGMISNSVAFLNLPREDVTAADANLLLSVFAGQLFKADFAEIVDAFLLAILRYFSVAVDPPQEIENLQIHCNFVAQKGEHFANLVYFLAITSTGPQFLIVAKQMNAVLAAKNVEIDQEQLRIVVDCCLVNFDPHNLRRKTSK